MAVYYIEDDQLIVYTQRGELAPARRAQFQNGQYWALVALGALAETEEEHYPVNCFTFAVEMRPAVERIFAKRKAVLEEVDRLTAEERVADVIAQEARALNPLDMLAAVR